MDAITGLLEQARGEKAPAERWNPSDHGQKETGRLDPGQARSSAGPRVAVIGAGGWGTAFGKILADGGAQVTMWARRWLAHEIAEAKRNSSTCLASTFRARWVRRMSSPMLSTVPSRCTCLSVPVSRCGRTSKALRPLLDGTDTPRGRADEGRRAFDRAADEPGHLSEDCDPLLIAVASGPNLALEIAREQATAAVIASRGQGQPDMVARTARNHYFRSFVNTDVIGTEFGGVLKTSSP